MKLYFKDPKNSVPGLCHINGCFEALVNNVQIFGYGDAVWINICDEHDNLIANDLTGAVKLVPQDEWLEVREGYQ